MNKKIYTGLLFLMLFLFGFQIKATLLAEAVASFFPKIILDTKYKNLDNDGFGNNGLTGRVVNQAVAVCPTTPPVVIIESNGMGTLAANALAGGNSTDGNGNGTNIIETSPATMFDCSHIGTQMVTLTATHSISNNTDTEMCAVTVEEEPSPIPLYEDADEDGFGSNVIWTSCNTNPSSPYNMDSDDNDASINPNAEDICLNGIDDNGNGITDEENLYLNFDGQNDMVDLGADVGNFGTGDFTVEARFRTTVDQQFIMAKRASCSVITSWSIIVNANGTLRMQIIDGSSIDINGTTDVTDGAWHHFAFVRDNGTITLYVDGQQEGSGNSSANIDITTHLQIGLNMCGNFGFQRYGGDLDELRFWNNARTATEIDDLKNATLPVPQIGLLYYFDFNNPAAEGGASNAGVNTLTDRVSDSAIGTLSDFALAGSSSNWLTDQVTSQVTAVCPTTPPVVFPGSPIEINALAGGNSTDECGRTVSILETNPAVSFDCSQLGTQMVMLTATHQTSNNTDTKMCAVSVEEEPTPITLYEDADGDGFGSNVIWTSCNPNPSSPYNLDSDDNDASINPNAEEICANGVDDNGNGIVDENVLYLNFDGQDDMVDLGADVGNFGTGDFTVEARFRTTADQQFIMAKRASCNVVTSWSIIVNANGTLRMQIIDGSSIDIDGTTDVTDGAWHHFAFVRENGTITLYVDGQQEGSGSSSANIDITTHLQIGLDMCGGFGFQRYGGDLDELRFWNDARTATEIDDLKNATLPVPQIGLSYYFDFNNPAAGGGGNNDGVTSIIDRVSDLPVGVLSNFALTGSSSNWITDVVTSQAVAVCPSATPVVWIGSNNSGTLAANALAGRNSINECGHLSNIIETSPEVMYDCNDMGTQMVTLTATNAISNNSDTETCAVNVQVLPEAICQDVVLTLDENQSATLDVSQVNNGSFSCDPNAMLSYELSRTSFDCNDADDSANNQSPIVTLTVSDASGSENTCTATITVNSVNAMAVCPDSPIQVTIMGNGSVTLAANALAGGNSTDECGGSGSILETSPETIFDCSHIGTQMVTLTATNGNNSDTEMCAVTVQEGSVIAACQDVVVQLDEQGMGTLTAEEVFACDPNSNFTYELSRTTFSCEDVNYTPDAELVGFQNFSGSTIYHSLVISDDNIYIANSMRNDNIIVRKYDGISWTQVGTSIFTGESSASHHWHSLVLHNDEPYIAYEDHTNEGRTSVMKYNGTDWEVVGTVGFSGIAFYQSLAFIGNEPYVAYRDQTNDYKASVMKFNGVDWEYVGTPGFTDNQAHYQNLATYNGEAYLAFRDDANGSKTTVMKFNGVDWEVVGTAGFSAARASEQQLVFSGGVPYVAYVDEAYGNKVTVMKYNGANWELVGTAGISAGGARYLKLAFHFGLPYIAYSDVANEDKSTLMKYNGTNWELVTAGFSEGDARYVNLALKDNEAYVSYTIDSRAQVRIVPLLSSTLTVRNAAGDESICSANITVEANIPYANCPDVPPVVRLDETGNGILLGGILGSGNSIDNCGAAIAESSPAVAFDCSHIGTQMVTLTASIGDNEDTEMCAVTVEEAPVAVCQDIVVELDANGMATISHEDINNNSLSNCDPTANLSFELSRTTFNCDDLGLPDPIWSDFGTMLPVEAHGYHFDMAFFNNELYVAYFSTSFGYRLAKYNGNTWENINVLDLDYIHGDRPHIITHNDRLYLLYYDWGTVDENNQVIEEGVTVLVYDGISWKVLGDRGFSAIYNGSHQLAFDVDVPYLLMSGSDNFYSEHINNVLRFNGVNWEWVGITDYTENSSGYSSLAIHNGEPYVVFRDSENGNRLTVVKHDGNDWITIGAAGFSNSTNDRNPPNLVFNNGEPYICYGHQFNNSDLTVMKFDGNNWALVGEEFFASAPTAIYDQNLFFHQNEPYVFVRPEEGQTLKMMKYDGNSWIAVGDAFAQSSFRVNFLFYKGEPYLGNSDSFNDVINVSKLSSPNAVTLTVTDDANQTDKCVALITVEDNILPEAVCPTTAPIVTLDAMGNGVLPADALVGANSTDNCAQYLIETSPETPFDCSHVGTQMVTLTVTDGGTNVDTEMCPVTIQDGPPTAVCEDITIQVGVNSPVTLSPEMVGSGSFDACVPDANLLYELSRTSFDCSTPSDLEPSWTYVGAPAFTESGTSYQNLAFHDGVPYIAFQENAQPTVRRYVGGAWEVVGTAGFSEGYVSYLSFAIQNDGTPYVAYGDSEYKATVMRFNGSTWEVVGTAGFSDGEVRDVNLAMYNDTPYVAYEDEANDNKATVMRYNGSTWEVVGTTGFSEGSIDDLSLAMHDDIPYIAYRDNLNESKTTVMRYNGSAWEVVGTAGFSAGYSRYQSITIHDDGTPYVAYLDFGNGNSTTVMRYNGSTWEVVGTAGFGVSGDEQDLVIHNGMPYVAFTRYINSGDRITVMRYSNDNWEVVGLSDFSEGYANYISLAINDDGTPYVAHNGIFNLDLSGDNSSNVAADDVINRSNGGNGRTSVMRFSPDIPVELTVLDEDGLTSSCTATITLKERDLEAICPSTPPTVSIDVNGDAVLMTDALTGNSTGNCDATITESSPETTFDCSQLGTQMVELSATDGVDTDTKMCTVTITDPNEACTDCPSLAISTPTVQVTNSSCDTYGGMPSGGVIAAPVTDCPMGTTLQYSLNGTDWSTDIPTYNQVNPIRVYTRCNCDEDNNISSEMVGVTTLPGLCPECPILTAPAPAIQIMESGCTNVNNPPSGGEIFAPSGSCPDGSTLEYSVDGGDWTTTLPVYDQDIVMTVETRCSCDADDMINSPTTSITTQPGTGIVCPEAFAGVNQVSCGSSFNLRAAAVLSGTGQWSFVDNPEGSGVLNNNNTPSAILSTTFPNIDFEDPNVSINPNDLVRTFTLRWTVTDGDCPPSVSDVTITLIGTDDIGLNQCNVCGTTTNIKANLPNTGNGSWSFVTNSDGMGSLGNTNNQETTLTGDIGGIYVLKYTLSNGPDMGETRVTTVSFSPDVDLPAGEGDGVQDCLDLCLGGDDRINSDGMGVPDGCDCDPNDSSNELVEFSSADFTQFIADNNGLSNPTLKVDFELVSDAVVTNSGKPVTFKAGNNIQFLPGFEIELGAEFLAMIEYCSNPFGEQVSLCDNTLLEEDDEVEQFNTSGDHSFSKDKMRLQVIPNVVQHEAVVVIDLPESAAINLQIFDQNGRHIRSFLKAEYRTAGRHHFKLNTSELQNGFYFLQLLNGKAIVNRKMVVQH